jgi:hypothetical protein
MAKSHVMTAARKAALKKAQLVSAAKRRGNKSAGDYIDKHGYPTAFGMGRRPYICLQRKQT